MATSGYKEVAATKNHILRFNWEIKSQSVTNNTTTINWNMKLISDSYGYMESSTAKTWKITIDGKSYSGTVNITHSPGETLTLASGTATISHSADGSKTFNYSFTQQIAILYAGSRVETISGSSTGTLTTIPRASTVAATNNYIESNSTITITRASSGFKHTLQYKINGQSSYTTIVSKTASTSYSWKIPTAAYNYISATAKTVTITINCITYNGSTKIGEKTTTLTATCKESLCKPTLAPTVKDTGSVSTKLTGDGNNVVIKDYNIMTYAINATANKGATLKSQKITCGGLSSTAASGKLNYVSSNEFVFTATDSRGFTSSQTIKKSTLINFVKLTCEMDVSAKLATDSSGNSTTTLTIKGNGKWFNGSFGAVTNTITVQYRYKTGSGSYSSWTSITPTKSGNTYSATKTITGLDYTKTYTVQVRAYDAVYSNGDTSGMGYKETAAKTVSSKPVFDWSASDFNFNVPVKLTVKNESGLGWYSQTNKNGGGLNMGNTDIVAANSIYFGDACNADAEGLCFPNGDGYDYLKAHLGNVLFITGGKSYELCYTKGSQMSIGDNTPIYGYITNARKSLFLTIPVNKPIVGATGFTISGKIEMRGSGGYLYNQASKATDKSATFSTTDLTNEGITGLNKIITNGGMLRLEITFSTALTHNAAGTTAATNNTPVCVVPNGILTITFT